MKTLNVFRKIQDWIVIIGLGLMAIITVYAVFNRFIFRQALSWSEEATRYIFIWVSLLGASIGVEQNNHANVSVFVDLLPKGIRKHAYAIANVLSALFCIAMVYTGIQLVAAQSHQVSAAMRVNMAYVYTAIPVAFAIMGINFILNIAELVKHGIEDENSESNNTPEVND